MWIRFIWLHWWALVNTIIGLFCHKGKDFLNQLTISFWRVLFHRFKGIGIYTTILCTGCNFHNNATCWEERQLSSAGFHFEKFHLYQLASQGISHFYGTGRIITTSTRACHCTITGESMLHTKSLDWYTVYLMSKNLHQRMRPFQLSDGRIHALIPNFGMGLPY